MANIYSGRKEEEGKKTPWEKKEVRFPTITNELYLRFDSAEVINAAGIKSGSKIGE